MSYELIISEKPNAAKKIAEALADGKAIKKGSKGATHYELTRGKKDIIVACAVGHLYTVAEKKKSFKYPSFDVEWVPTHQADKSAKFSKKYLDNIKKLAKEAKEYTVACDYDIEGEVIGLNIIKYACKQKDARRMKFSTLVEEDLQESYDKAQSHLDWGQARAGETRHILDWFYGINLSRALTLSVKAAGSFKVLSAGRVQGPALKILVDKEKEIRAFKPEPYWQIRMLTKEKLEAWHEKDKFFDEKKAGEAYKNAKGKKAEVKEVDRKEWKQSPPAPFDLGSLQSEAYRCFNIKPKQALQVAQELYTAGYTSYPRTSSQKLPPSINYQKILTRLKDQSDYEEKAGKLLSKKSLKPNEGKKSDPAHPAIYPTGVKPQNLKGWDKKIYDLIVKRFLATFAKPATRETMKITLDAGGEEFHAKGTRTLDKQWHEYYEPYVNIEEKELPKIGKGKKLEVKKLEKLDKETQPPKRYTPASIISELEKINLGTKATRADIIENLYDRGYINNTSIEVAEIGIRTAETLQKYAPEILDLELTKEFDEEMDKIRQKEMKPEEVLEHAKKELKKILEKFKEHEKSIGKELIEAERETWEAQNTVGKCPKCKKGKLMIKKGKYGRFVACSEYPECKATFKIPQNGFVKTTDKTCEECNHPMLQIRRKRKRPQTLCINPECPTKKPEGTKELKKEVKELEKGEVEKECPKCGNPLVTRKSIYGEFLGCSNFPKCRYTEQIKEGPLKEDFKKKEEVTNSNQKSSSSSSSSSRSSPESSSQSSS